MKVLPFVTWISAVVASPAHRTVSDVTWLWHPPLMRDSSVKYQIHGLLIYHIHCICMSICICMCMCGERGKTYEYYQGIYLA